MSVPPFKHAFQTRLGLAKSKIQHLPVQILYAAFNVCPQSLPPRVIELIRKDNIPFPNKYWNNRQVCTEPGLNGWHAFVTLKEGKLPFKPFMDKEFT